MVYRILRFIISGLVRIVYRYHAEGMENVPPSGPVILVVNHLHLFDPGVVATAISRKIVTLAAGKWRDHIVINTFLKLAGVIFVKRGEVDRRAREAIAAHGLAERFTHHTGHGVGWKYHEPVPMLNKRSEHVLEPGMVFSFEPAVYVPQLGGVRNEDAAVVTADGIEVISPFPVALG